MEARTSRTSIVPVREKYLLESRGFLQKQDSSFVRENTNKIDTKFSEKMSRREN